MEGGWLIVVVIWALFWGVVTAVVGESKGEKGPFWWGFFLGPIGLLIVAVIPRTPEKEAERQLQISAALDNQARAGHRDDRGSAAGDRLVDIGPRGVKAVACGTERSAGIDDERRLAVLEGAILLRQRQVIEREERLAKREAALAAGEQELRAIAAALRRQKEALEQGAVLHADELGWEAAIADIERQKKGREGRGP